MLVKEWIEDVEKLKSHRKMFYLHYKLNTLLSNYFNNEKIKCKHLNFCYRNLNFPLIFFPPRLPEHNDKGNHSGDTACWLLLGALDNGLLAAVSKLSISPQAV